MAEAALQANGAGRTPTTDQKSDRDLLLEILKKHNDQDARLTKIENLYLRNDANCNIDQDEDMSIQYSESDHFSDENDDQKSTAAYSDGIAKKRSLSADENNNSAFTQYSKKMRGDEQTGPEIDTNLAILADQVFLTGVDENRMKELRETTHMLRPENCKNLKNVKVDLPIWNKQDRDTQMRDLRFQQVQKAIATAGCGLVNLLNTLSSENIVPEDDNRSKVLNIGMDILAIIGQAHNSLCYRRRDLIRDNLSPEYRSICAQSNPIGETLFGDNFDKTIDTLTKANKMSNKISKNYRASTSNNSQNRSRSFNNYKSRGRRNDRYKNENYKSASTRYHHTANKYAKKSATKDAPLTQ